MHKAFKGKAVLVAGASLGIGREMALQLTPDGARIAAHSVGFPS